MFRTASLTLAMAAVAWLGSLDTAQASHRGRRSCCCCQCESACGVQEHVAPAAPAPESAARAPSTRRYSYEPSAAVAAPSSRSLTRERGFGTTPRSPQMRSKGDPGRYNF